MSDSSEEQIEDPKLMNQLSRALRNLNSQFCCGGSIQVIEDTDKLSKRFENIHCDSEEMTTGPLLLRWDVPDGSTSRKLKLPPSIHEDEENTADITALLEHCQPATFGKSGEDIFDESYRKAVKLDSDQFSTNFSPHEVGIIDAVAQTIMPSMARHLSDGTTTFLDHLGVVAELYKLNVSTPSPDHYRQQT